MCVVTLILNGEICFLPTYCVVTAYMTSQQKCLRWDVCQYVMMVKCVWRRSCQYEADQELSGLE